MYKGRGISGGVSFLIREMGRAQTSLCYSRNVLRDLGRGKRLKRHLSTLAGRERPRWRPFEPKENICMPRDFKGDGAIRGN